MKDEFVIEKLLFRGRGILEFRFTKLFSTKMLSYRVMTLKFGTDDNRPMANFEGKFRIAVHLQVLLGLLTRFTRDCDQIAGAIIANYSRIIFLASNYLG
jgi:hypothetical protein